MDIIHPNVPETIKRLADAYEYLVERGGASIAYSLLLTSGKMRYPQKVCKRSGGVPSL